MTIQSNQFSERIRRIEAGGAHTRNTLFVGMDEAYLVTPDRKVVAMADQKAAGRAARAGALAPLAALVLGAAAWIGIEAARFHHAPWLTLGDPLVSLTAQMALALALSILVAGWLYRPANRYRGVQLVGVGLGAFGMHNLVHLAPWAFASLFSQPWVEGVLASTAFRTMIVRGVAFAF
jgi:hypothetical protein